MTSPKYRGQKRGDQQRAPESDIRRQREGEIAAQGEEIAVREIDHVAEIDNQRQPSAIRT